jgi:hypothetical protein
MFLVSCAYGSSWRLVPERQRLDDSEVAATTLHSNTAPNGYTFAIAGFRIACRKRQSRGKPRSRPLLTSKESAAELTAGFRIVNDYAEEPLGRAAPVHDRPETRIHDATGIQAPSAPSPVCAESRAPRARFRPGASARVTVWDAPAEDEEHPRGHAPPVPALA